MMQTTRQVLISAIIERELAMFLAVNSRGGTAACQERPESFRLMREVTHGVLSDAFLQSYLGDLEQAALAGRNCMTEKYALMEGLIPPLSIAPAIREIVQAEGGWRREVAVQFPRSVHPDGHESFCLYLGCELQTYSPATLTAYRECVEAALRENRNLARERYELLMRRLGYDSLQHCETSLKA
ncbi:MAG: DUF4125 family protein [Halodesulfovibrio sp.]